MPEILCSICARGGSKGVLNKNVRSIAGKPLIAHTVEQALASGLFAHVVVSTDSPEIRDAATAAGAEAWFLRPAELASDTAAKLPVIRHVFLESEAHFGKTFEVHVDLDATSPLRSVEDIRAAVALLAKNHGNVITATPSRRSPYFNLVELGPEGQPQVSKKLATGVVRRQDAPPTFDMNASIYVWRREVLLSEAGLFNSDTGLYVMPEERSIDIDSELDFRIVEMLLKERTVGPA